MTGGQAVRHDGEPDRGSCTYGYSPHRSQRRRGRTEPLADFVANFSKSLGLGESTGWKLIREGKVRPIRIGKRTLVPRTERDRILAQGAA